MKSKTFSSTDNEATDQSFVQDYPGEPVPEERFTHSHPYEEEEEGFTQTLASAADYFGRLPSRTENYAV